MSPVVRRRMTLLDAILLVGSAAVGLGLFELVHRTLFKGWIWIADLGIPDFQTWSTTQATRHLLGHHGVLAPGRGTVDVLADRARMRSPRPTWRRIWRQPGMAACLAALFALVWTVVALLLAMNVGRVARVATGASLPRIGRKSISCDEVFMYVGLAVAATWLVQYSERSMARSADWIDCMGRVVGVVWIVIGLVWTLHEYIEFV